MNFWDFEAWSFLLILTVLGGSLLLANLLKKSVRFLKVSLIPTSVLGGLLILAVTTVYKVITGELLFNAAVFGGNGMAHLEIITYHALALGFIATTYKPEGTKLSRKRSREVFNTGVSTVSSYLLQAVLGFGLTLLLSATVMPELFGASGLLLMFGFGQGTGQAMNWGSNYESQGFIGGTHFGLTIAALGFLSAAIGGVIHLNILRRKGKVTVDADGVTEAINAEEVHNPDQIPMNGSIDKMTVQVAIILCTYFAAYLFMWGVSALIGMQSVIYGFNFLFGVLFAVAVKKLLGFLKKKNVVQKEYINPFLMKRLGGFFFDLMIVAGIAAIDLTLIAEYWWILLLLAVIGAVATYFYNHFIAVRLFPGYAEEQFLVMYGMLTGTASTGMILLREADPEYKTPAADNLVYQNLPAIVFGFPMMLLAPMAPTRPILIFLISVAFFAVMNLILFRSFLFRRKNKKADGDDAEPDNDNE